MTITSKSNQHLIEIRRLAAASARERSGRFAVEGEDLVMAADAAGFSPVFILRARGFEGPCPPGALEVEPELLASVSAVRSGSRVLGVFEQRWAPRASGPLAVALWGVRDAGNVGTVIRSARAFGASCVALGPGCADPYGPRATRASMGAIFAVALAAVEDVHELPGTVIALAPGAGEPLRGPLAASATLLIGGERDGLSAPTLASAGEVRSIPQARGDSLNAAMAATVALYEATRMADR